MELTLSSGGSTYSMSPIVSLVNPNGGVAFTFGTGDFLATLSSPQNTQIHQPYTRNNMAVNYEKWLVSMSDRAWRNSLDASGSGVRELYPTNSGSSDPNENFKLPSMTRAFAITVPAGTFDAVAGTFVLGLLRFRTTYVFSQRRTDISDLLSQKTEQIRVEERARAMALILGSVNNQTQIL
jgi:hypothetical protein